MNDGDQKIECWNCGSKIKEYFDEKYKGHRGQCPECGVNFPLD